MFSETEIKPHFVDDYVGKRLKIKRSILGISQEDLAEKLNVTFQQVQKYEKGVNRISASRLYEVSQALGEPVAYFFEGLPGQTKRDMLKENAFFEDPATVELLLKRETMDLVKLFYRISNSELRKQLKEVLKAVANSKTP